MRRQEDGVDILNVIFLSDEGGFHRRRLIGDPRDDTLTFTSTVYKPQQLFAPQMSIPGLRFMFHTRRHKSKISGATYRGWRTHNTVKNLQVEHLIDDTNTVMAGGLRETCKNDVKGLTRVSYIVYKMNMGWC